MGGLSEGNVQIAHAIATDISDESQRGSTMALVGACFSIAFTIGPAIGAALSNVTIVASNPFAAAAGCSLLLIVLETVFLYIYLPETHPRIAKSSTKAKAKESTVPPSSERSETNSQRTKQRETSHAPKRKNYTNHPILLNITHFLFLLPFSGLEFSLPFVTATLYATADSSGTANTGTGTSTTSSPSALNGRLLSVMGLIASLLQGTVVRRLPPLLTIRAGVVACAISFFLLARVTSVSGLYVVGSLLAVTTATVVTGLNSLGSMEAEESERGVFLGKLRSWGQAGRAAGPVLFCSLFWWAGRETAYTVGAVAMVGVCAIVFGGLRSN